MSVSEPDPFSGPPPDEVMLDPNPLARVLAQVRFPAILVMEQQHYVAPIQEQLRTRFPRFERVDGGQVNVELREGVPSVSETKQVYWRMTSEDRTTSVTISRDMATLDTQAYQSRSVFVSTFAEILGILQMHARPAFVQHASMRYVNRLPAAFVDANTARIPDYARGFARAGWSELVVHSIAETQLRLPEGDMLVRCGILPPEATFDPNIIEPSPERSWILDLDLATRGERPFDTTSLETHFHSLAARSYAVFRAMIGDAIIEAANAA